MAEEATEEGVETPGTEEATSASTDKGLSQEQVDAIVKDRLARERAKYADYEDLKSKASKLDELELQGKSELEKAQQTAETAKADAAKAIATANERLMHGALLVAASKAGVDSSELLLGVIDKAGLTVADDGTVSGTEDAVKAAIEKYPQLVGKGTTGSADQGARGGGPEQITQAQLAKMSPEQVQKALTEGKLNHLLAAG